MKRERERERNQFRSRGCCPRFLPSNRTNSSESWGEHGITRWLKFDYFLERQPLLLHASFRYVDTLCVRLLSLSLSLSFSLFLSLSLSLSNLSFQRWTVWRRDFDSILLRSTVELG